MALRIDKTNAKRARRLKEVDSVTGEFAPFDVLGSYTGISNDGSEPEQDADDL